MNKNKLTKRILSVVLVVCMLMAYAVPANAVGTKAVEFEQVDNSVITNSAAQRDPVNFEDDAPDYDDDDIVRVSIVLEDNSTIAAGYSTENIVSNRAAMRYRDKLEGTQEKLVATINRTLDVDLEVVWNLTLAANMISANVAYGDLEKIKEISGVADVIIETRYEPAEVSKGADDPNMAISTDMTGTSQVWQAGYTGAGSRIAIIDTGLDIEHEAFNNDAFLAALEEDTLASGQAPELLGTAEIADVLDELNAAAQYEGLTADDLYINEKIPFGFNYVDSDLDVTHLNDTQGEHGSHVAGIAAANRYNSDDSGITSALENHCVVGNAPDAQVLVMKVFGKGGGAYDSDYMAAIEDAIVLGCDSVNLSLGSGNPGMSTDSVYQELLNELAESDTVVVISAGNSGYWAEMSTYGYLYSDDVSFQTNGSPGSFTNAFTVASVDNDGSIAPYFMAGGQAYAYIESSGYGNAPLGSLAADGDVELEYVFVDGIGQESDYEGIDLTGKAVFCSRGTTSFYEKGNVAAAAGAAAIFIYNNQPGTINMDLTGYLFSAPCVSIAQADGAEIKANSQAQTTESGVTYYTGTITITDDIAVMRENSDTYTMSSFSSWGVPGDLSIKPEITAPGGNIYSLAGQYNTGSGYAGGHDQYELMSGTSMAAPQITGMTAVLKQYIEDQDLSQTGLTDRALAQSLLMSTAVPLKAADGYTYSVLQQGAGLANLLNATQAGSYVLMDDAATDAAADGKVKAELGDDPDRTGSYTFSFTLNNLTDVEQEYTLSADVFIQDLVQEGLMDTSTTQIGADVTFVSGGKMLDTDELTGYDFNADGQVNKLDAELLMDHVVLGTDLKADQQNADVDVDDDVDTHDVYTLLTLLDARNVTVPADGSAEVQVTITLTESAKSYLDTYYPNGTYIEAFVNADAQPTGEGVQYADHSIPVLAFFGSWTESTMFDKGSVLEYTYSGQEGMETRVPYLYYENYAYGYSNYFGVTFEGSADEYVFGGNLFAAEDLYLPERNALNSTNGDMISSVNYTLIRNAADVMVTVTDVETGEMYLAGSVGAEDSAYYYVNGGAWENTRSGIGFNWAGTDAEGNPLPEGTTVEITLTAVPEYYYNDDGTVNSARAATLSDGASYSIQLTIDNTAPTLEEVLMDEENGALSVVASDNRYLAAVQVYAQDGDVAEPVAVVAANATEPGQTISIDLGQGLDADVYLIQVLDYAGNATTYRAFLNTEETDVVEGVVISDATLSMVKNNSVYLDAKAMPVTLSDRTVTWSSSDETIATVDQNGKVTALGVGQCVITAASVLDETKTASCTVDVIEISADLNGVVWDENGEVWFSQFNTNDLPNYTKLTEESADDYIASVAYGAEGKLFAATMDTANLVSSYYEVDPATFELTKIGDSSIGYMDLAYAPNVLGGTMLATYGPYVAVIDSTTGDYIGAFNWSSSTLVGIAYAGSVFNNYYGEYVDVFYLLDRDGNLYQEGFMNYNGGVANFYGEEGGLMSNTGVATNMDMLQSMYYNGEHLFISNFVYADDCVTLYAVDIDNTGSIFYMGQFAQSVWPVGGLFELSAGEVEATEETAAKLADAQVKAELSTERIQPVELKAPVKAEAPTGSLNAAPASAESNAALPMAVEQSGEDLYTVYIYAKDSEGTLVDTTNGLISVDWNSEELALADYWINGDVSAELEEDDSFVFGYAGLDTIPAGEEPAAILKFQVKDPETMADVSVSVTHKQVNNDHIEYTEDLAHEFEAVVTEPTCTEGGYTTHTCVICGWSYVDSYTDPTGHAFGEWVVTVEPTCTEAGVRIRTCANEGCDAAESEVIEALGHDYEAEVTPPTETEQGYTTHTCTRCGDSYADSFVDPVTPEDPTEPEETEPEETTEPTAPSEPSDPNNSQTGDSFQMVLWATLLVVSLAGTVILLLKSRKWLRF